MKRLMAFLLIALLSLCATAQAAEWPAGRSPAQPYVGVPEVDLNESVGYMLMYPKKDNAAEVYCDTLYIYLPREDVALGEGMLRVMDESGEIVGVAFDDAELVKLYPLDEETLEDVMWGGGTCIEIWLPVSLPVGNGAWITMDEGCITAAGGSVRSGEVAGEDGWRPEVAGGYGVGKLRFTGPDGEGFITDPAVGDRVAFEVTVGGEIALAAITSKDGSVSCVTGNSFQTSGEAILEINDDDFSWTVYFMNDAGEILDYVDFNRDMVERE